MNVVHKCQACGDAFACVPCVVRNVGGRPHAVPDLSQFKDAKVDLALGSLPLALCPPCTSKKIDELVQAVAALQEGGGSDFA